MEPIGSLLHFTQPKKAPRYSFQEVALEIIKLTRLPKEDQGLVWTLYKRKGEVALRSLLAEIQQGEVKGEPIVYIKWLLKNDYGKNKSKSDDEGSVG